MNTAQASQKFREGMQKFQAEDYSGAKSLFTACLKDAPGPSDKKILQGLIDDTKLGSEIQAARKMVEQKNEKKAIAKAESAVKSSPQSSLVPLAQRFIRETEELIYCILDDFEPGDGLQKETAGRESDAKDDRPGFSPTRWRSTMSFNSDPSFISHGKGSMKWKVGGSGGGGGPPRRGPPGPQLRGYCSAELKSPIPKTKWRYLAFYVCLPEADDGSLQVSLAATPEEGLADSLCGRKLVDLRGKKGWLPVHLDLTRDFANTRNVKLEDVRFIRIEYPNVNHRTIYLDFVHME